MSITISNPADAGPSWSSLGLPRLGWACLADLDVLSGCPANHNVFERAAVHACVVPSLAAPELYRAVRQELSSVHHLVDDAQSSIGLGCFDTDGDEVIVAVFDTNEGFGAQALARMAEQHGFESVLVLDRFAQNPA